MLNFYFIKIVTSLWRNNKIRRGIKIFLVIENASIDARHTAIPICALYARPFATDIILWPHINAGANQTCMRVMRHQHGARLARHCRALVYLPFAIGSIFPTPSLFLSLRSLLYFSSLRSRAQVARALGFRAPVSAARTRAKISQTDTHTHIERRIGTRRKKPFLACLLRAGKHVGVEERRDERPCREMHWHGVQDFHRRDDDDERKRGREFDLLGGKRWLPLLLPRLGIGREREGLWHSPEALKLVRCANLEFQIAIFHLYLRTIA